MAAKAAGTSTVHAIHVFNQTGEGFKGGGVRIDKLRCSCQRCSTVFDAQIVVDAPIAVAAASMQAVRCPNCSSTKCGLGGSYDDAPPTTAPLVDRVLWWQHRGEHGVSSATIFRAMTGIVVYGGSDGIPYDPDDFRRCCLLLTLIPEWKSELGKVAEVYPYWKPFIDKWAEMDALFIRESPAGRCPELYALMQVAVKESRLVKPEGKQP